MIKFTIVLTVLFAMTIKTNGQIPNNGFENWGTITDTCDTDITVFDNPNGWSGSCQAPCTPPYSYSIEKNIDNYPSGTGLFSVIITSDTAKEVRGLAGIVTGNQSPMAPAFPITGHPTSLTGYYKFLPLNGDTMNIVVVLFQSGAMVAGGTLKETETISNWTSFNVPISAYTTADSALIFLTSFNLTGGTLPHGNSALYIDNLNFDNLITSVSEQTLENTTFILYPNPAFDIITLNINNNNSDLILNIYNVMGTLIKSELLKQNQRQINIGDLSNGVYMVTIKSKDWTENQRLIIQR